MIINDSILSLQIFPQVLPKMQSKLFEECRKPEGHAPLSGTAHTKNVELLPNDLRGSDLILNEEELKKKRDNDFGPLHTSFVFFGKGSKSLVARYFSVSYYVVDTLRRQLPLDLSPVSFFSLK